jgi:hydrogenase maturation protease
MKKKVAVIGVGNLLLKDDGIGIHAVRAVKEKGPSANIEFFDCDTRAFQVLEAMDKKDKAIIIDAYKSEKPPGTISVFDLNHENFESAPSLSMHDFSFVDALKSGVEAFDLPEEITVIGVEPKEISVDDRLSDELEKVLPKVVSKVLGMF